MNKLSRPILAGGLLLLAALILPTLAAAQALPTPGAFVRNLDVRCYKIPGADPNFTLRLDHLNPVLTQMGLPFEIVELGSADEFCVPVFKNNTPPPNSVLPFMRFVDFKCHNITGPSLNLPLSLTHLNPVLPNIIGGGANVIVREPQQLCVPVYKNNAVPPAAVAQLVRWLDLKCYRVESQPDPTGRQVQLHHLNPLITNPPEVVTFQAPAHQLCVPVMKNQVAPPPEIRNIVQWADTLCYRINGAPLNRTFQLTHLNPVLAGQLPPEVVTATTSTELCVPVAKNGAIPPG